MRRRARGGRALRGVVGAALCALALCAAPGTITAASESVAVVQTTASLSQALTPLPPVALTQHPPVGVRVIRIDTRVRYQTFEGIGGAMTDSAAWLIADQLRPAARRRLVAHLFGRDGIGLSFLRVPIGASDFTRAGRPYSYDGGGRDQSLRRFSIARDAAYVLPAIRSALRADPALYILASPWSPPGWMKSNGTMVGGGTLRPSAYKPLARYIVRFLEAYAAAGIPIEAVTPQNEPDARTAYPSMSLPEPDEARLIARYLKPELRRAGLGVGVFGVDSSWVLAAYASSLAASEAGRDLAGIAWHCYLGSPEVMSAFHRQHPGLEQIVDECSPEIRPFSTSEFEIASLRNWASVVSVWNLALDPSGGPVQQHDSGCSGCDGVVTVDPAGHTFRLGLKYFELGQVSRFVQRGARRVDSNHSVSYGLRGGQMAPTAGLDDVAFQNPDGTIVLVATNTSTAPIRFAVESSGRFFDYRLRAAATVTLRWR